MMFNFSLHAGVSPTTEEPSPVPTATGRTEILASQQHVPRSPPSSPSRLAKVRRSLSTAVGGAWGLVRKAGRPFRRTPKPPAEATSPRKGSSQSMFSPSDCEQGPIEMRAATDITDEESGSNSLEESWERWECASFCQCGRAGQREAPELSGKIVEVRPPPLSQFDRNPGNEFSADTSPASETDKEDGPGIKSGFKVSELVPGETEGHGEGQNTNAAVVSLECAGRLGDALPRKFSTRPPMNWKKTAELCTERQFAAKNAAFIQDTKDALDSAVEKDTTAQSEVEDTISPLSVTHPFMMWERPPGMRTPSTLRTYGLEAKGDKTEGIDEKDVVEPQFIGRPQKSGGTRNMRRWVLRKMGLQLSQGLQR